MRYWKIVYLATTLLIISPVLQAQVSFSHRASHRLIKQPIPRHCSVEAATLSMDLERGTPLSFLDAHIKHGNGLIGALPALLGIAGVAGAVLDPDGQAHLGDRAGQVALDIRGQGLERAGWFSTDPIQ